MNRPVRIVKKLSCKRDQIGLSVAQNLLGVMRFRDQSDGNGLDAGFATHAIRIGDMIARMPRNNRRVDRSADSTR